MALKNEEKQVKDYLDKLPVNELMSERRCHTAVQFANSVLQRDYGNRAAVLPMLANMKRFCLEQISTSKNNREILRLYNLYWEILRCEGRNRQLDSYLLYLEKNRIPKEKFYQPKRNHFLKIGVIQAMQDLLDDKLDILSLSMPPGTGKTTLEKFFHSAIIGWFPEEFNLFYSHSADITRMYYDGVLSILEDSEYTWKELFPSLSVTSTNAKMGQINVGKYKPFQNLMTASVGSEMAGKVRASYILLVDDMIGKIEEALNKNMLDKLWNAYTADARQRKIDGCKELHIATRWSVHDIIGRLKIVYAGSDRVKFISVPDIDPVTGKSNFDYDVNGFSVEFFHDQEKLMDNITYRCLYKNEPIEREGLLYLEDELRHFETMPDKEPDAIIGVCDTKSKGTDYMVLPVMYQYGDDYYLVDCICDNSSDFGQQYSRLSNIILSHNMQQVEFESNAGGDRIAFEVSKRVSDAGGRCNITSKPTETNKETRIFVNSDWIKKHVLFKSVEQYAPKTDYDIFMTNLLSYSVAGKNIHDDVPDCLANFALFVNRRFRVRQTVIMKSPF